jgi:hypothetical protein
MEFVPTSLSSFAESYAKRKMQMPVLYVKVRTYMSYSHDGCQPYRQDVSLTHDGCSSPSTRCFERLPTFMAGVSAIVTSSLKTCSSTFPRVSSSFVTLAGM